MEARTIKTVGLIGLGAVGVLYAERLLSSGAALVCAVDAARARRYREEGLFCNGKRVELPLRTPEQAERVDLMIFATKIGGLEAAMETAAGFIGPDTVLVCLTNGVTSESMLAARFGAENVLYAVAQGMDAVKTGNRLVYEHPGMIVLGEREPGEVSARVAAVADFLNGHGVKCAPVGDMVRRQWSKWMLNVGVNQAVMVYEGTYGAVQRPGEPRETMLGAMREAQTLARLEGYEITEAEFGEWVALVDSLAPEGAPSMRQDGAARRKSEVELFAGTAIRLGKKHGVPTPVNDRLYARVREIEAGY